MKTKGLIKNFGTRRDMCFFVGRRAGMLKPDRAARAWALLAQRLEAMGDMDVPKFLDVMVAIRASAIMARRPIVPAPSVPSNAAL